MNTSFKPHNPGSAMSKLSQPTDTITDTALGAVDSVKNTVGDAVDRGQAVVNPAPAAASDMAKSASQQVTTFASELEAMTNARPDLIGVAASLLAARSLET